MMQRKELRGGAALTILPADQFKTSRITINFILPSDRQSATAFALLPSLLERCYAGCPDMTLLSRKLASLYGANLSADTSVQGENRVVSISICGIKEQYALHGEGLTAAYADILFGTAFDPCITQGRFDEEAVAIERQKLRELLEGEINNKRSYCVQQARRLFFGEAPAGVERNGYLGDLDGIDGKVLARAYDRMVRTARVEVLVLGADPQEVERRLLDCLDRIDRAPERVLPAIAMPPRAPVFRTEAVEAVQGKLCLFFTAGRTLSGEEMDRMRLAGAILGSLPSSRLFRNVREKQSLCYYCACGFSQLTSALCIDSGIEPKDADRAREAILHELDALAHGPIGEEELREAKVSYLGALRAVGDSLASIEAWAFREILRGSFKTPQEVAGAIEKTGAEEIHQVLSLFRLSVCYLLTTKGDPDEE